MVCVVIRKEQTFALIQTILLRLAVHICVHKLIEGAPWADEMQLQAM